MINFKIIKFFVFANNFFINNNNYNSQIKYFIIIINKRFKNYEFIIINNLIY